MSSYGAGELYSCTFENEIKMAKQETWHTVSDGIQLHKDWTSKTQIYKEGDNILSPAIWTSMQCISGVWSVTNWDQCFHREKNKLSSSITVHWKQLHTMQENWTVHFSQLVAFFGVINAIIIYCTLMEWNTTVCSCCRLHHGESNIIKHYLLEGA